VIRIRFTDHDSLFTLGSSAGRESSSNLAVAMSRFDFMDRHLQSPIQVRETLSACVGGNDEPVSIVAMRSNIAFDFVELKLDGVLHDG
jgi:hypothetical protein